MDSGANPFERTPLSKALQNALIMDEISKYISLVDMMNCRSANKLWKIEWTSAIQKRSKSWMSLTDNIDMLVKDLRIGLRQSPNSDWDKKAHWNFVRMDNSKIGTKSSELIQWMSENLHSFPCSKFSISTKAFKLVDQSVVGKFFYAMLNIVTELHLESSSNVPSFQFNQSKNLNLVFHNLAILKIEFTFVSKEQRERNIALKFYQNIIKLAPNLDTLSLANRSGGDDGRLTTGCTIAIKNAERMKTLHIRGTITNNLVKKLTEKNFHLTELELFFETFSNVCCKSFEYFLSTQNNSLARLHLKCKVLVPQCLPIVFPQMGKLELLEIETYDGLGFPGLNLQQSFPRLKHLKTRGIDVNVFSGLQPVGTLEEFGLGRSYTNQNNILQICKIFPNLKNLSVPCKQSTMLALNSATMNRLEELTLVGESEEMMRNIIEALTGVIEDDQGRILVVMRRGPLAFLHKIKVLRLVNGFLTDTHCMLGLMDLQSLQCLDLRMNYPNKKHKISEAMLEQLRGKFAVLV